MRSTRAARGNGAPARLVHGGAREDDLAKKDDTKRWSGAVTKESDALDLKEGVFTLDDPGAIARSLRKSAEESHRRKADPYRSAMSMLTFYINCAGDNLPDARRRTLEKAKDELRKLYGKKPK